MVLASNFFACISICAFHSETTFLFETAIEEDVVTVKIYLHFTVVLYFFMVSKGCRLLGIQLLNG